VNFANPMPATPSDADHEQGPDYLNGSSERDVPLLAGRPDHRFAGLGLLPTDPKLPIAMGRKGIARFYEAKLRIKKVCAGLLGFWGYVGKRSFLFTSFDLVRSGGANGASNAVIRSNKTTGSAASTKM